MASTRQPKIKLVAVAAMSAREIKAWATAAKNHAREIRLRNGLVFKPDGSVSVDEPLAKAFEASEALIGRLKKSST